jgi:hypothetical protein
MPELKGPAEIPELKFPVPHGQRIVADVMRIAFISILAIATLRVSMPQNETIWTAYDTTGDLIRLFLGLCVCVWLGFQLFGGAPDRYRTWLQIGPWVIPFALICLLAIW